MFHGKGCHRSWPVAFGALPLVECPAMVFQRANHVFAGKAELPVPGTKVGLVLPAYRLAIAHQITGTRPVYQPDTGLGIGVVFQQLSLFARGKQLGSETWREHRAHFT
jgi:hypothetical protein